MKLTHKAWKLFWKKIRLFFVCDISDQCAFNGGPGQLGYELAIPTKLLKVLMPVLIGSLAVLKIVLQMHGVPAGLVPNLPDLPGDSIIQAIMSNIPSFDEVSDTIDTIATTCGTYNDALLEAESQLSAIQEGQIDELFRLIQKSEGCAVGLPLTGWEPRFTGLTKTSVSSSDGVVGRSQWVLPEHQDLYTEHGEAARGMLRTSQTNKAI
jgi:hypothetical protein